MTSSSPPRNPFRVLIVEGHDVARRALADHLTVEPDIQVVGAVSTVSAAIEHIVRLEPFVAVIDVQLPDGSGFDLCRQIRTISPLTYCIIHARVAINPGLAAEADAVVLKQIIGSELLASIRNAPF